MKVAKALMIVAGLCFVFLLGVGLAQLRGVSSPVANAQTATVPGYAGLPSFADIAQRVDPAVVSITALVVADGRTQGMSPHGGDPFFDPFEFFFGPRQQPRQRGQKPVQESGGSGFIISSDGYVLTNHHVVENADKVTVKLSDGPEYPAKVVGKDAETDVALLKIEGKAFPTINLGDSDAIRPGDWVMALGNPLMYSHTVTVGIISAKGRRLGSSALDDFLQTDAAINFGNSGGPLVNLRGEVVGINTAITRYDPMGRTVEGIGFAIPINMVKEQLEPLKTKGKVERGWLGVTVAPLDGDAEAYFKQQYGTNLDGGALVQSVEKTGPAGKAGLEKGDIIVGLDGQAVKDSRDLVRKVSIMPPGKSVTLSLYRDGKKRDLKAVLGDRARGLKDAEGGEAESEGEPEAEGSAQLGITVQELTRQVRMMYQISADIEGVMVSGVEPTSNAFAKGVREGAIILEVNKQKVATLAEYKKAVKSIRKGDTVALYVLDQAGESYRYFKAD